MVGRDGMALIVTRHTPRGHGVEPVSAMAWGPRPIGRRPASADHTTMPLQHATRITPSPLARARRNEQPTSGGHASVNTALDLLEQHRLSPMELRILLAVRDRERT